jgi:hypothetical protein
MVILEEIDLQEKPFKPAIFSLVRALLIFIAGVIAVSTFVFIITDGADTKQIFMSTEGVADMQKRSDEEIVLEYQTDDFYSYFILSQNEIQPFSMVKKIGMWVFHYPSRKNLQGFTPRTDGLYFYDSLPANGGEAIRAIAPSGEIIEPLVQKKIQAGAEERIAFVFLLPQYLENLGDYRLEIVDAENKNVIADLWDNARFTLIEDKDNLAEFASRRHIRRQGENEDLWPLVDLAVEKALESDNIQEVLSAGQEESSLHRLEIVLSRDMFLKTFSKNEFLAWPERAEYIIMLRDDQASLVKESIYDYTDAKGAPVGVISPEIRYFTIKDDSMLKPLFKVFE